jgi:hypothetical protein
LRRDAKACCDALDHELYACFLMTVHDALAQAHPEMGRKEFVGLGFTMAEIIDAVPTCWLQTGMRGRCPFAAEGL